LIIKKLIELNRGKVTFVILTAAVFFIIGFRVGTPEKESSGLWIKSLEINPEYISHNQYKIDILEYIIDIDLDIEARSLRGDVTIRGIVTDMNLRQIDLNFYDNFVINSVQLNGDETPFTNKKSRLSIPLSSELDTFEVRVLYRGRPQRAGLGGFVFGSINKNSAIYTLNEPIYASSWFPCNDLPSDKAQLKMSITNDSSKTSLSNGRLISVTGENGKRRFNWETVYPISTYLIAVYSAEYVNFNDIYVSRDGKDTMNIEYYAFPHHLNEAKIDFGEHPKMMEYFAETFGEYPFIKEKYGVAEFLWQFGAMENQTITGIGSNFVSGNRFFTDTYVHELAHSWWGNAVGPETWQDIWLNEGFATYSEALYTEHLYGEGALISTMMSKFDENFQGRLYDPGDNLFSNLIYSKGAWVLHMLRWETGDSLFFDILRTYFNKYKYKTASTRDFQQLVETLTVKDFSWFFNQWVLEGDDQIYLDYNWNYDDEAEVVMLKTRQVQKGYDVYSFSLPVEVVYREGSKWEILFVDKREAEFSFSVEGKPLRIVIDPLRKLLANYEKKDF
jgi:aminopeptidase N